MVGKKMGNFIDISGQKFNRWTVIERVHVYDRRTFWLCKCDCGVERPVEGKHVRYGTSKSCGCLCLEINAERLKGNKMGYIHGYEKHPLRAIRKAMTHRCYNSNNRFFKNYGQRGISVCNEWRESLISFIDWAISNGWKKGLSIDRIDVDGNYEPNNCRWITIAENSRRPKSRNNNKLAS
jgi:hypothetical protein